MPTRAGTSTRIRLLGEAIIYGFVVTTLKNSPVYMRTGILLVAILWLSEPATLQAQVMPGSTDYYYSQLDTVRAVEHLFRAKRNGGKIYRTIGLPIILIGTTLALMVAGVASMTLAGKQQSVPVILVSGGVGLIPVSIGLARSSRYSRHREQIIITLYQHSQGLPPWVQRRLKAKFFR